MYTGFEQEGSGLAGTDSCTEGLHAHSRPLAVVRADRVLRQLKERNGCMPYLDVLTEAGTGLSTVNRVPASKLRW